MPTLACRHVVLGERPRRVAPAAVRIEDDRIAAVDPIDGPYVQWVAEHPDAVDLGDRLLSPAFINGHTHVVLAFLRGVSARTAAEGNMVEDLFFRLESRLTAGDAAAFARLGAYECLLGGQALVWDHYYHAESVADAVAETGLNVVMAPTLQDLGGPGRQGWGEALAATERLADRRGAGGVWAAVGPHATDTVSADLWRRAGRLAIDRTLPVHAHIAQSIDEVRRVKHLYGQSPVAWLADTGALDGVGRALLVHGLYVSRADIARLDPRYHALGYCPCSQWVFGFEARVDVWQQAGFSVALGTDAAPSNDAMNVQKELRALSAVAVRAVSFGADYEAFLTSGSAEDAERVAERRRAAVAAQIERGSADGVLDAVWSVPGRMHPGFVAGVIEPGAIAHLAAWSMDHPAFWPRHDPLAALAFGDPSGALHGLWVAGRSIGARGRFAESVFESDAYRQARTEADERWRRLLSP